MIVYLYILNVLYFFVHICYLLMLLCVLCTLSILKFSYTNIEKLHSEINIKAVIKIYKQY